MDLATQNFDSGAIGFVNDINDTDYSNFSFRGHKYWEKMKQEDNEGLITNIKPLPFLGRRRKLNKQQLLALKKRRLRHIFGHNKFLQNWLKLSLRRQELLNQMKMIKNQAQLESMQQEVKTLEAQLLNLKKDNSVSLQKKVEGAIPTEIIEAVMVNPQPISDTYIDTISESVSDKSVLEIPTNDPNETEIVSTTESGSEVAPQGEVVQQIQDKIQEQVDKVDLPTQPTKKNWLFPALAIGVVAYLILKK